MYVIMMISWIGLHGKFVQSVKTNKKGEKKL